MTSQETVDQSAGSITEEVRRMKEAHASRYDFDPEAIAAAARENQTAHPERVILQSVLAEGGAPEAPTVRG